MIRKVIVNRMDQRKNVAGLNAGDIEAALGDTLDRLHSRTTTCWFAMPLTAVYSLSRSKPDNNVTRALSGIHLEG